MLNILIAEDEEIERNSLVKILKTSILEIGSIYQAADGCSALKLYKEHTPDIVLMDINMPGLSGLECIQQIKQCAIRTVHVVILTSYDYFSYAQTAISLGVDDFLLKPATPQTIISSVSKVMDRIRNEKSVHAQTSALLEKLSGMRSVLEDECVQLILSNQNERILQQTFQLLQMPVKRGICIIVWDYTWDSEAERIFRDDLADYGYSCLSRQRENRLLLFLLFVGELRQSDFDKITKAMERCQMLSHEIGIGSLSEGLKGLYRSYCHAQNHRETIDDRKSFHLSGVQQEREQTTAAFQIKEWIEAILEEFNHMNDDRVSALVQQMCDELVVYPAAKINAIAKTYRDTLLHELQRHYQGFLDTQKVVEVQVSEEDKYQQLYVNMVYLTNSLFLPLKSMRYQNSHYLVKQALAYIHQHYDKALTLNDVAKQLKVTPFYISKLLNRELNKPFTELINECRIEEAKRLLKAGKRVKEIAGEVGFQSSGYFAKIFKMKVGITPTEYRNLFF